MKPLLCLAALLAIPAAAAPRLVFPLRLGLSLVRRAAATPTISDAGSLLSRLREHAPLSALTSDINGADPRVLEAHFMAAAGLERLPSGREGGWRGVFRGSPAAPDREQRRLRAQLSKRVLFPDLSHLDERAALDEAVERLLATPTGRHHAGRFLAEEAQAVVHFADFPGSRLIVQDNRRVISSTLYALTAWLDRFGEVLLNRHFVDADAEWRRQWLPALLGHELLGHVLQQVRAARMGADLLVYHCHELSEIQAHLLEWLIDHELDGKLETHVARNYLADPAGYLRWQKLLTPTYVTTFSSEEMGDVLGAMRRRADDIQGKIADIERELSDQRGQDWPAIIDHFIMEHGVPEDRFALLRRELIDLERNQEARLENAREVAEQITAEIAELERQQGEDPPDHFQNWMRAEVKNPFFGGLAAEVRELTDRLGEVHARGGLAISPAPPRPDGQLSFDELQDMYAHDELHAPSGGDRVSGSF